MRIALFAALVLCVIKSADSQELPEVVDFNQHIKPILSDRCYKCHGPDEETREADLRLDTQKGISREVDALDATHVVLPSDRSKSELFVRITSDDSDMVMPPPDAKLELTKNEIDLIGKWIDQGAKWNNHWSLIAAEKSPLPEVRNEAWCQTPIDRFVLAKLEQNGFAPADRASKETLIRRLSFDLTGLPPTLEEIDAFLKDESKNAYEKQVDRLLKSARYGERMAVDWLDVARYADTYGYQSDVYREMWPWRDWVIRAFNDNLPFDQFITWQLAGDLLPDATRDQKLATAFNRHHRQTNEGGSVEEEFRVEYVSDRVNTMGAAFLGLTLECCRCHDHKYDPISQKEYYEFSSFFANIDESGLYSHFTNAVPTPTLLLSTKEQQAELDSLEKEIEAAERALDDVGLAHREAFREWLKTDPKVQAEGLIGDYPLDAIDNKKVKNRVDEKKPGSLSGNPKLVDGKLEKGLLLSGENNVTFKVGDFSRDDEFSIATWIKIPKLMERAVVFHRSKAWTDSGSRGYQLLIEDGKLSASLIHFWPGNAIRIRTKEAVSTKQWIHVCMTYDGSSRAGGLAIYVDGQLADTEVVRNNLYKTIKGGGTDSLVIGQRFRDRGFKGGMVDEFQVFNRQLTPIDVSIVYDSGKSQPRLDEDSEQLFAYYLSNHDESYKAARKKLKELRKRRSKLVDSIKEIMVMKEMEKPRSVHILKRGAYDAPGEQVSSGTPESMFPMDASLPKNRLGLAQWLTDPKHPLTSRVTVNRFWQSIFGVGLVATTEDFGNQGQLPTHPQLLDWLSIQFVESGWDTKGLMKLIVMSSTYQQSALASEKLRAADPDNVLLGRAPSRRLPAEMLRDNALTISGLLVNKIGGPPVKPYQPDGLWADKSGQRYKRDAGEGSHRRSLYTYWKRTSPPPAMMTLDSAKRDVCVVKRQTTATPQQALVLLNDPQYVEAARALAEKAMRETDSVESRIGFVFRSLTSRMPSDAEARLLGQMFQEQLELFKADIETAKRVSNVGDLKLPDDLDPAELAASTVVTQAIFSYGDAAMKQ